MDLELAFPFLEWDHDKAGEKIGKKKGEESEPRMAKSKADGKAE